MNEWNEGYFTDVTYTYGYYRELSPVFQRFCLLLRGFEVPEPREDSTYCELGYGQGVSINIHAASNLGQYFGTDFNPAHAAHTNKLRYASGCNASFFDDSFEEFYNRLNNEYRGGGNSSLQFDSISLHGIWSWISAENRAHIVEFAKKFLKPGGMFYNSYNCFPGWAPNAPMRELMIAYDKYGTGNSNNTFNRVDNAFQFIEKLIELNPNYAQRVPGLKSFIENTKKMDHNYLAHEYFNRD